MIVWMGSTSDNTVRHIDDWSEFKVHSDSVFLGGSPIQVLTEVDAPYERDIKLTFSRWTFQVKAGFTTIGVSENTQIFIGTLHLF